MVNVTPSTAPKPNAAQALEGYDDLKSRSSRRSSGS